MVATVEDAMRIAEKALATAEKAMALAQSSAGIAEARADTVGEAADGLEGRTAAIEGLPSEAGQGGNRRVCVELSAEQARIWDEITGEGGSPRLEVYVVTTPGGPEVGSNGKQCF